MQIQLCAVIACAWLCSLILACFLGWGLRQPIIIRDVVHDSMPSAAPERAPGPEPSSYRVPPYVPLPQTSDPFREPK